MLLCNAASLLMWRRVEHQSAEVTPAFAGSFCNGCNSITRRFFVVFFYILKSQLGNCSLPARVGLFSRSHHWKPVSISSTIIYLTAQSIKGGGGNCCVSMFCSAERDMHERDGGDLHCKALLQSRQPSVTAAAPPHCHV